MFKKQELMKLSKNELIIKVLHEQAMNQHIRLQRNKLEDLVMEMIQKEDLIRYIADGGMVSSVLTAEGE